MGGKKRAKPNSPLNSSYESPPAGQSQNCHKVCHKEIIGIMEAKFKELREYIDSKVSDLLKKTIKEQSQNQQMKERKRMKFVIHGLQEKVGEKTQDLEKEVTDFLSIKLKIGEEVAKDMISGTSRMGKLILNPGENQNPMSKCRPIVLELLREKHRALFLGKLRNLKGPAIKVQPYLTKEEKVTYNEVMMKRRKLIKEGKKVQIIDFDELQVGSTNYKFNGKKVIQTEGKRKTVEPPKVEPPKDEPPKDETADRPAGVLTLTPEQEKLLRQNIQELNNKMNEFDKKLDNFTVSSVPPHL